MQTLALLVSAVAHACWDNVLVWLVHHDPDASLLHMLWLRMAFMAVCLAVLARNAKPRGSRSPRWWLQFSIVGWVIPTCTYSLAVLWTGYRMTLAFQPFIPLGVALRSRSRFEWRECFALMLTFIGSLVMWTAGPDARDEFWMIWVALLASIVHAACLVEWFVMLDRLDGDCLFYMSRAANIGVLLVFVATILWTPQHLAGAFAYRVDAWAAIVLAAAVASACKFWVVARFTRTMPAAAVAIFECVHPVATLASDIARGDDVFEWQDALAIALFGAGWILYPKHHI